MATVNQDAKEVLTVMAKTSNNIGLSLKGKGIQAKTVNCEAANFMWMFTEKKAVLAP